MAACLCLAGLFLALALIAAREQQQAWQSQLELQHQSQRQAMQAAWTELQNKAQLLAQLVANDQPLITTLNQAHPLQQQSAELRTLLAPIWQKLQRANVQQLQLYFGTNGRQVLHFGPSGEAGTANLEPPIWVANALLSGQASSAITLNQQHIDARAVVPIRVEADHPPIGAIELSVASRPALAQLDKQLGAGLALILNKPRPALSDWQLAAQSRPQISPWLTQGWLPEPGQTEQFRLIQDQQRSYLLSLLPLDTYQAEQPSRRAPLAATVLWRDVSALAAQQLEQTRALYLHWTLAWLLACTVLWALLNKSRQHSRQQHQRHQQAIDAQSQQTEQARELLDIIAQAQAAYISAQNHRNAFDALLTRILQLTDSQFGFIGEALYNDKQQPYLRTYAITNIAWDQASRDLYAERAASGIEFRNPNSLIGQALSSGALLIANDPLGDPRSAGLPPGHPPLSAFIGLPIHYDNQLVGLLAMANRPDGYTMQLAVQLQPLLTTLGQLIEALHRDTVRERTQQQSLRQQQALRALNEITSLPSLSRIEQIRQALRLGVSFFNMPLAIVSKIAGNDFEVLVQVSPEDALHDGQHLDLSNTYCQLAIQQQKVVAIEHMAESIYADMNCYKAHKLESYIGCPTWVNGKLFGVLNFASPQPRSQPFDDVEHDFISLLARWVGSILERDEQEQGRQELLARLQHIASQVPGAIYEFQINPDGRQFFPFASEGLIDIYGVSPADIREDSSALHDIAHPEDREKVASSIFKSMQDLSMWQLDFRVQHPSKGLLWVEGRSVPQRLADGSTRWYGFLADITKRKLIEEQLQQAQGFLQAVVNSATEIALITTDPTGRITLFNSGAEQLLGYSANEMLGQSPAAFHLEEEITQRSQELSQELQRNIQGFEVFTALPRNSQAEARNWTYVRKDQQHRLVHMAVTAIRSEQNEILGFLGIATDVTKLNQVNSALLSSERRFRNLASSLPGVVYHCSNEENWPMLYLSDEIERMTGYPASEFINNQVRSLASLVHPDDSELAHQHERLDNKKDTFELCYRIRHRDGHWLWVREKGRTDYDAEGSPRWFNGFIWDITEQRLAELERNATERKLSALYELAPVGITLTRVDSGQIIDSNPEFQRMLGMSAEQVLSINFVERTPPEFQQEQARQLALLLENGTYGPFEKELVREDGSRVQALLHGVLIEGPDGSKLIWSIVQDISARVASENAAREREKYIRTLFDSVIDALIITDEEGRIEDFNPAAEHMFGFSPQTLKGRMIESLSPDPQRKTIYQHLGTQRLNGDAQRPTQRLELQGLRCDGEVFPLEFAISETHHQGRRKFIGVMRDITERNRADRLKSEFVSSVSHELRTPLTAIAGALGLITGGALGPLNPQQQPMLAIAYQNSQRLNLLINDLLDMDKLLAGKMHFALRQQPLQPLLDEALLSNQSYAAQFNVQLSQVQPTAAWVNVDDLRLQQVLTNYLANAAKFSPNGAEVLLKTEQTATRIRVIVEDHGPGIAAEFRDRIFQKFSQADASDTRQKGGTGLGLAICKELIERMGGSLGFDSEEGQGSSFWFELPCSAPAPAP